MKTLEISSLQSGIDATITDIEALKEQNSTIQRAVNDFSSLDEALKGEGGNAIKAFCKDCHLPFLIMFHQSMTDYKNVLEELKNAVSGFEGNSEGLVKEDYLENDVKGGYDKVEEKTIELTDDANSILDSINDLVTIDKINETEVVRSVQRGKQNVDDIVSNLHALDESQVKTLHTVKEDLYLMRTYLSEIESRFESGNLSISDYNVAEVSDIKAFRDLTENVYGEDGIFGLILGKLEDGQTISATESDALYHYFQTQVLNDGMRIELEEIANLISGENSTKLTDRLNKKVVISEGNLEKEMAMIQAYLFLGTKSPGETDVDYYDRSKLEAYAMLLNEYHSHMVENNVVMSVGDIEVKENHKEISGYYLKSIIEYYNYNVVDDIMSKDRFRDWSFNDPDNFVFPQLQTTEITYATGTKAANNIEKSELSELEEEYAYYEAKFIGTKVVEKAISALAKKANLGDAVDIGKTLVDMDAGAKEMGKDITVEQALSAASDFEMEVAISETNHGQGLSIQLYPSDETLAIINRWKERSEDHPKIDFPEDEINKQDWYEVSEKLRIIENELGSEITDSIYGSNN